MKVRTARIASTRRKHVQRFADTPARTIAFTPRSAFSPTQQIVPGFAGAATVASDDAELWTRLGLVVAKVAAVPILKAVIPSDSVAASLVDVLACGFFAKDMYDALRDPTTDWTQTYIDGITNSPSPDLREIMEILGKLSAPHTTPSDANFRTLFLKSSGEYYVMSLEDDDNVSSSDGA